MRQTPKVLHNTNPIYRLGNIVLDRHRAVKGVLGKESLVGSLGYEYVKGSVEKGVYQDLDFFKDLVKKRTKKMSYSLPDDNELVVHLRLGDRLYLKKKGKKQSDIIRVGTLKRIRNALSENPSIDKITVVTGIHFQNRAEARKPQKIARCQRFLDDFVKEVEKIGIKVNVRSTYDIDSDFCYLSNASFLVISFGSFSRLAGLCCSGKVYDRPDVERNFNKTDRVTIEEVTRKFNAVSDREQ